MANDFDVKEFSSDFLAVGTDNLPDDPSLLRDALVSDAIRLAVSSLPESEDGWAHIHINSLRHWVERKLHTIIDLIDVDPDIEDDWFRDILRESRGPTLTFLGDILELDRGYYSAAPTRVIEGGKSTAILISGLPTSAFTGSSLEVNVMGVTRIVENADEINFKELGIPIQSRESYVGVDKDEVFDQGFALDLIDSQPLQPWAPREGWIGYQGRTQRFGFSWGEKPREVLTPKGQLSLWKIESEFGDKEFWLKVSQVSGHTEDQMLRVPRRLNKQICLIIDSVPGQPRNVEFLHSDDSVKVSCNFNPPRAQVRWLHAIGAAYDGFDSGQIHWRIDPAYVESTVEIFDKLAINVKAEGHDTQP